MTTFSYTPSYPAQAERAPKVRGISYGDGYELRTEDGINSFKEVWNLSFFSMELSDGNAIDDFLKTHKGVNYFQWTTPKGLLANFICKAWTYSLDRGNKVTITAKFEQVFDPA